MKENTWIPEEEEIVYSDQTQLLSHDFWTLRSNSTNKVFSDEIPVQSRWAEKCRRKYL